MYYSNTRFFNQERPGTPIPGSFQWFNWSADHRGGIIAVLNAAGDWSTLGTSYANNATVAQHSALNVADINVANVGQIVAQDANVVVARQTTAQFPVTHNSTYPPRAVTPVAFDPAVSTITEVAQSGNGFTVNATGMFSIAVDHWRINDYFLFPVINWNMVHTTTAYGGVTTVVPSLGAQGLTRFMRQGDTFSFNIQNIASQVLVVYASTTLAVQCTRCPS